MGNFKEQNGKTRVGAFLQNCGPVAAKILDFAGDLTGKEGLNNLSSMISGSSLSPEIQAEAQALIIAEMQEVTKRWESDDNSGYWLPANVRPMFLIFMALVVSCFCFMEGAEWIPFKVSKAWVDLFKSLLGITVAAYFGSRGLEKITKTDGASRLWGKFKRNR